MGADLGQVFHLARILLVVRDLVVGARHTDRRIAAVRSAVAHHEADDARSVGLKGKDGQIHHQLHVLGEAFGAIARHGDVDRRAVGAGLFRRLGFGCFGGLLLGVVDALLECAHRVEVFIQFALVGATDVAAQGLGVAQYQIEHALVESLLATSCATAAGELAGVDFRAALLLRFDVLLGAEQPLEDRLGVDLLGHRGVRGAPRDIRRVSAGVARVAVARLAALFDADLQRG